MGIVANQRKVVKSKGEMQFGGVIYSDSADKEPALHRQLQPEEHPAGFPCRTSPGYGGQPQRAGRHHQGRREAGERREHQRGPKFTIIIGNSYDGGDYAMCGKAYDPRLIVGTAPRQRGRDGERPGPPGCCYRSSVSALKGRGEDRPRARGRDTRQDRQKYEDSTKPLLPQRRGLWLDAIIDRRRGRGS